MKAASLMVSLICLLTLCVPAVAQMPPAPNSPPASVPAPGTAYGAYVYEYLSGSGTIPFYYQWVLSDTDHIGWDEVSDSTWSAGRAGNGNPPGQFRGWFLFNFVWDSETGTFTVTLTGEYDPNASGDDSWLSFDFVDTPAGEGDEKVDTQYQQGGETHDLEGGAWMKWTLLFGV